MAWTLAKNLCLYLYVYVCVHVYGTKYPRIDQVKFGEHSL